MVHLRGRKPSHWCRRLNERGRADPEKAERVGSIAFNSILWKLWAGLQYYSEFNQTRPNSTQLNLKPKMEINYLHQS